MPLTLPASLPRLTLAQAPLTCEIDAVNEYGEQHKVSIPAERALTVYVDKRELVTLMTLGAHPELLVLGFLRNQRLLKSVHEIESITVDWDVGAAAVKTRHGIEDIEEKTSRRVVTTGCGQGSVFGGLMDEVDQIALPPAAGITQSQLYSLVNTIRLKETTYKSAGSVHACALFDASLPEPEMLLFVEDVGRHNAMDTIAGWMWMKDVSPTLPTSGGSLPPEGAAAPAARQSRFRGPDLQEAGAAGQDGVPTLVASPTDLGLEGLVFYTTGRMTSEMVIKSAQMGVPVVVSRSGITQMGHQVAQTVGLCAIGRATNKRFVCYSRAQRLTLQPGLVTKTDVTPDTARQRVSSGA
ncbi:formate dehydrogenase accessory sulfurtransferase FdhD [Polaromonas sp.]|uniref:formate dehydrogenase accessory sulfurtransferase FdhD n=1 Tax=Polaromonas sp. TaxID=1869339 RepID=UPI0027303D8F|nr:formate dehydrogenase accessory sulfurtransferase FdhD [Polaromonas sp.]